MNKEKIIQLQGFRAVAILCVFFHHTMSFLFEEPSGLEYLNLTLGRGGVTAFLMLSGFLMSSRGIEIPRLDFWAAVKKSWIKFSRLYPLHVMMLIVAFIALFPSTKRDWVVDILSLPFNLTLTHDLIPFSSINNSFNGPSWYISSMFVIWILIYLFPNVLYTINRAEGKKLAVLTLFIFGVQIVYMWCIAHFPTYLIPVNHPQIYLLWLSYYNPFWCYTQLLIGCCIARLGQNISPSIVLQNFMAIASMCVLAAMIWFQLDNPVYKTVLIEIIIGMGLIAILSKSSLGGAFLTIKPIVFIGNISGSLFLVHGSINYVLRRFASDYIDVPFIFFVSFAISVFLSVMYEVHVLKKKIYE